MTRDQQTLINAVRYRWSREERALIATMTPPLRWRGLETYPEVHRFYVRHGAAIWDMLADEADTRGLSSGLAVAAALPGASWCAEMRHVEALLSLWAVQQVCRREQEEKG